VVKDLPSVIAGEVVCSPKNDHKVICLEQQQQQQPSASPAMENHKEHEVTGGTRQTIGTNTHHVLDQFWKSVNHSLHRVTRDSHIQDLEGVLYHKKENKNL